MGCNPECYTKGRGCVISKDNRCALLFEETEKPKIKSLQEAMDAIIKENRLSNVNYKPKKIRKIAP